MFQSENKNFKSQIIDSIQGAQNKPVPNVPKPIPNEQEIKPTPRPVAPNTEKILPSGPYRLMSKPGIIFQHNF